MEFQLDFKPLVFHWYCYWVPTGFPIDFHLYIIEIQTGYPMDFNWYIIEISSCFSSKFPMDINGCFLWNLIRYFIEILTRLNGFPLIFLRNFDWIPTGFQMSYFWYSIENSSWFSMDFHWYSIEISTGFPISYYWHFI